MALRHLLKPTALSMCLLGTGLHCNGAEFGQPGEVACTTVLVEKVVDSSGGILEVRDGSALNGARLEIQRNALARPTVVRLTAATDLPSQGKSLGPALCVQMGKEKFAEPVFLVMPYSNQQLGARAANYLAIGALDEASQLAEPVPGLIAADQTNELLGTRIAQPGHFQAITRGDGALAKNPNLDVLFVVDNSGSMLPKQKFLAEEFPTFFQQVAHPAHFDDCIKYHVAVTTTDVGRTVLKFAEEIFSLGDLLKMKKQHPTAKAIAHPECPKNILEHVEYIGGTEATGFGPALTSGSPRAHALRAYLRREATQTLRASVPRNRRTASDFVPVAKRVT